MKFTNSRFLKQSKTPTITSTPSLNSRCSYASITCKYRRNLVFICSAKTGTASTPSAQSARHLPNLIRNHRHQNTNVLPNPVCARIALDRVGVNATSVIAVSWSKSRNRYPQISFAWLIDSVVNTRQLLLLLATSSFSYSTSL